MGSSAGGAPSGAQVPALADHGGSAGPEHATPDFMQKRTEVMMRFQGDVMTRLNTCVGPATQPPKPRNVRFVMEWQAERSRAQLQMFTVRDAILDDVAGISDAARQCIERMRGMPVELPIATDQLPRDSHLFEQHLMVPIP